MTKLETSSLNGHVIDPTEEIPSTLMDYIDKANKARVSSNSNLLDKDYLDFKKSVANASVLLIDEELMSAATYDDIDLSGENDDDYEFIDARIDNDPHYFISPEVNAVKLDETFLTQLMCKNLWEKKTGYMKPNMVPDKSFVTKFSWSFIGS